MTSFIIKPIIKAVKIALLPELGEIKENLRAIKHQVIENSLKIDTLEKRFDLVDERFNLVDDRFEQIDKRIERLENEIHELKLDIREVRLMVFTGQNRQMAQLIHEKMKEYNIEKKK